MSGEPFSTGITRFVKKSNSSPKGVVVEMDCVDFTNDWRWRMFELLGQA
jgi:hypothetical protein